MKHPLKTAHALRLSSDFEQAYQLICQTALSEPTLAPWLWMHDPRLWQELTSTRCTLTRRSGQDAEWMYELWHNAAFMRQFHRMAKRLPDDRQALHQLLDEERAALVAENGALHWVIRNSTNETVGLLSILDINIQHRRGELLLGVVPGQWGVGPAAVCMAAQFFFGVLKFHKLVALVHEDNRLSMKTAMSLGFQLEGRLQDHFCDPTTGQFSALLALGLRHSELLGGKDHRLIGRLMGSNL